VNHYWPTIRPKDLIEQCVCHGGAPDRTVVNVGQPSKVNCAFGLFARPIDGTKDCRCEVAYSWLLSGIAVLGWGFWRFPPAPRKPSRPISLVEQRPSQVDLTGEGGDGPFPEFRTDRPVVARVWATTFTDSGKPVSPPPVSPPERIFNVPAVVLSLVVSFLAIQALRSSLTLADDYWVVTEFAFVPIRLSLHVDPAGVQAMFSNLSVADPVQLQRAQFARAMIGDGSLKLWTLVTYAFLHGDWFHVLVNSLWLLAFGAAVERRFGAVRFLLFFLVTALAGALAHYATHRLDWLPVVGASAAVSGAMAAATRFVFQPGAPLGGGFAGFAYDPAQGDRAFQRRALPLAAILRDRRALTFLGIWFIFNYLTGVGALPSGPEQATVAWQAHVGGFLVGLFLFRFFDPPHQSNP
jgi:membrane associated rhomboid family serine protease